MNHLEKLLIKKAFERLRTILKQRSAGEYNTWGFVAMFMEMIDEAEKQSLESEASHLKTPDANTAQH